jgi:hypothetical protein
MGDFLLSRIQHESKRSFEIGPYYGNQFFRPFPFGGGSFRAEDVMPNMTFDYFVHQPVDGAAGSRNQLKDIRAFLVCSQRMFNRFDLAADAPHSGQKGLF